ncbi:hypothetical protein CYMTET_29068 [Cymbomonas tetramitiformis]|uniref:Pop1 N-terminal domain-containing protein n=1 Tax=Cymbomonas tetramitiformis TaxID=36881 RepID=A0AAE0FLQ2_9CHLO|nr:hypothetical protein CYMTET_29068 [Cymbomonas tetramitiformis]
MQAGNKGCSRSEVPRTLDVRQFAEARAVEIRALLGALELGSTRHTAGAHALPRSLRRRARSHKCFKWRRRPNLHVRQLRVAGLEPPNKRKRRQVAVPSEVTADASPGHAACDPHRPTNRKMRRRPGALQQRTLTSSPQPLTTPAGAVRWLETHQWTAKRQQMQQNYGMILPQRAVGRGHGARSVVASCRNPQRFVVHDASYHCALQLAGSQVRADAAARTCAVRS